MNRYPKDSEHEYIWNEIQWRYFAECRQIVDPLRKASMDAFFEKNIDRHMEIERLINQKSWELSQVRCRREENLYRLWLDSELRKEGKTYAEVYEREQTSLFCP